MRAAPVLVIGGSGTLGTHLLPLLLDDPTVSRVRVMSRGEHRQSECFSSLAKTCGSDVYRIDWLIGDVRDSERVDHAMEGCESVFNFAAMKSVDRAEYDGEECSKTNVNGVLNVVRAARKHGVARAMFTSTDKAVSPTNIYGASKLLGEKLFILGNIGASVTRFSCCRYGNVLSSQGSVLQIWTQQRAKGLTPTVTDPRHTRFFITPTAAADFVYSRWCHMSGGEIFVPKMKSTTVGDLLLAFGNRAQECTLIGARPGEKEHESLISPDEASLVTDCGEYFIRWPYGNDFPVRKRGISGVKPYTSASAERFTLDELKDMISEVS